jgi:diguanylate cyclase (GGDEF)-like protein
VVVWRRKPVARQSGNAPAEPPEPTLSVVAAVDRREDAILASVTADLASADSGVEFVYRSIERMQSRSQAEDVLVILDEPPLGRQAFRAGRKPIESSWARELVRTGTPGVHAIPSDIDGAVASSVLQLCSLALRLDVARHDSLHDPLTGLLNRRAFDEHLAASCAQAQRYGWSFGVVLLDLDGFKVVNDRLGHAAGDATLRAVGAELRHNLRIGDAAARVGGDEFALVLPNIRDQSLREIIERIEISVEEAVPDARVTLTAGHASAPDDGLDADVLYRVADQRLYEGKRRK